VRPRLLCPLLLATFVRSPDRPTSNGALSTDQAGPSSGAITGTVLDPTGAAIANAQVFLLGTDSKTQMQGTTGNTGSFSFNNVPPGEYILQFRALGFHDARVGAIGKQQVALRVIMQIAVSQRVR